MDTPSEVKFKQALRHFANVYFGAENMEDMLNHGIASINVCNTCKMFYDVVQSIEDDILGHTKEDETLDLISMYGTNLKFEGLNEFITTLVYDET